MACPVTDFYFYGDTFWIPLLKIVSAMQWEVVMVVFYLVSFSLVYFFLLSSQMSFFQKVLLNGLSGNHPVGNILTKHKNFLM